MNHETLKKEFSNLLTMMNIHYKEITISVDTDLHTEFINIRTTRDTELLLENNKSVLRDLNIISREFFKSKFHYYKNIVIDVNHIEQNLVNHTKEKALLAVERVQFFDKPYEFGYLNSYERMIVHSLLKNYPRITTESVGEGRDRRLVVKKTP